MCNLSFHPRNPSPAPQLGALGRVTATSLVRAPAHSGDRGGTGSARPPFQGEGPRISLVQPFGLRRVGGEHGEPLQLVLPRGTTRAAVPGLGQGQWRAHRRCAWPLGVRGVETGSHPRCLLPLRSKSSPTPFSRARVWPASQPVPLPFPRQECPVPRDPSTELCLSAASSREHSRLP